MARIIRVSKNYSVLGDIYPIDYSYGSRASVFGNGLRDGIITKEEYNEAKDYYGNLWHYVGD